MPKITDRPLLVFLGGMLTAFAAGLGAYTFLEGLIADSLPTALAGMEEKGTLPKALRGNPGTGCGIGSIVAWPGNGDIPTGWMECKGTHLNRKRHARLFKVLGETYGKGDGDSNFELPKFGGMFLRGARADQSAGTHVPQQPKDGDLSPNWGGPENGKDYRVLFNRGATTPVYPEHYTVRWIIRVEYSTWAPMKHTLVALHEVIELATKTGEPVALELDVDRPTLDALAFTLGHSFTWVVLPGGGGRLDGAGEQGVFTLNLSHFAS